MFKFAALAAVASASWRDEIEQENALEMWKYTVHEKEINGLKKHAKNLETSSHQYGAWLDQHKVHQVFEQDFKKLVHTHEFVALAKYVEAMKKKGPTPQIKAFKAKYMQQMKKVEMAHHKMEMHAQKSAHVWGNDGDHHMTVEVDNDEWYAFNAEYYKLREMEYYAMYKIPEIVKFREHLHQLRATKEWAQVEEHWGMLAKTQQHQAVVKNQGTLLVEALKTVHMSDADEKWVDPHYSPVMFDVWHMVYLYFVAVGHGDLQPMLDFIIDGKYDDKYVEHVKPEFGKPEENLYLF